MNIACVYYLIIVFFSIYGNSVEGLLPTVCVRVRFQYIIYLPEMFKSNPMRLIIHVVTYKLSYTTKSGGEHSCNCFIGSGRPSNDEHATVRLIGERTHSHTLKVFSSQYIIPRVWWSRHAIKSQARATT